MTAGEVTAAPAALPQTVRSLLDDTLRASPDALGERVHEVERAIVRLRDALIALWRAGATAGSARVRIRQALERADADLGLAAGVEYPNGGIDREGLTRARGAA